MRVRAVRRVRAALLGAGAGVLAFVVSGCEAPDYTYVGDSGHDFVLRVPRSWSAVDTDDALDATKSLIAKAPRLRQAGRRQGRSEQHCHHRSHIIHPPHVYSA